MMYRHGLAGWFAGLILLALLGCSSESEGGPSTGGGLTCAAAGTTLNLPMIVRDFQAAHPDMETFIGAETGILATTLDGNQMPVYVGGAGSTTTGQTEFDQWYRDVGGVNMRFNQTLTLTDVAGTLEYANAAFFPIDGQGFGEEGNLHNYHFTTEVRFQFRFGGGEQLDFLGDDDFWAFINSTLAIDLGGVHGPTAANVNLADAGTVATLGLVDGQAYDVAIFQAERHTTGSNYTLGLTGFTFCTGS